MQQYLPLIIIVISMLATVGGMIFLLNAGRGLAGEALPGAGIR